MLHAGILTTCQSAEPSTVAHISKPFSTPIFHRLSTPKVLKKIASFHSTGKSSNTFIQLSTPFLKPLSAPKAIKIHSVDGSRQWNGCLMSIGHQWIYSARSKNSIQNRRSSRSCMLQQHHLG